MWGGHSADAFRTAVAGETLGSELPGLRQPGIPDSYPRIEAAAVQLGLRAVEERSRGDGAAVWPHLPDSGSCAALLQHFWNTTSVVESLHGRSRDLCLAADEREWTDRV